MNENENGRSQNESGRSTAGDPFSSGQSERINFSGGRYSAQRREEQLRQPERIRRSDNENFERNYYFEAGHNKDYAEKNYYNEKREGFYAEKPEEYRLDNNDEVPTIKKEKTEKKISEKKRRKENRKFLEFTRKNRNSGKSKDELRREYAEKTRKKRKRRIIQWFIFTAMIFAAIFVVASMTVLFPIEEISVSGKSRYSTEQIIKASGVETGDNLWRTSAQDVLAKVSKELPYIGNVTIERNIPATIILNVEETKPEYAVANGKKYILVDKSDKILETDTKTAGKLLIIEGLKPVKPKAGEPLNAEDSESYQTAKEILEHGEKNKLKFTSVNVSDENNLSAVCSAKVRLELGSATQLTEKMKMANEVLTKLKSEGPLNEGVINLKSPTKAFYKDRPLEEATTEPETEPESQTDENGNIITTEPQTDENGNTVITGQQESTTAAETTSAQTTSAETQSQSETTAPAEAAA